MFDVATMEDDVRSIMANFERGDHALTVLQRILDRDRSMARQLQSLEQAVDLLSQRSRAHADKQTKKIVQAMQVLLNDAARATPAPVDPDTMLEKSLRDSDIDPFKAAVWGKSLREWFGQNGGKKVLYSKEAAARLLGTRTISLEEHARWKRTDRLPDWVKVA